MRENHPLQHPMRKRLARMKQLQKYNLAAKENKARMDDIWRVCRSTAISNDSI